MKQISIVINESPMPQNHVYRRRAGGGMYLTKEAQNYKGFIGRHAAIAMQMENLTYFLHPKVTLQLYFKNARADIDGPIKLILDSLNEIAWVDDVMIEELHVYKTFDPKNPRIEITITETS